MFFDEILYFNRNQFGRRARKVEWKPVDLFWVSGVFSTVLKVLLFHDTLKKKR